MRYDFFLHDMQDGKKVNKTFVCSKRFDEEKREDRHLAIEKFVLQDSRFDNYLDPNAEGGNRIHSFWSAEGVGC